ncbi:hypothetical protein HK099_005465 [Clydaea vesicula]|uniref:Uncharacterized protein n=1 Tax=Clydaea vesicula TaxID=447962 RepID=A0AAD5XYX9_9FUNG|nr:hypothetical protein HK099_005465 [Clydaea vesicula]KAJ3387259.1 hypothetical protein HDU92_002029 [Lobulomyces angularis]
MTNTEIELKKTVVIFHKDINLTNSIPHSLLKENQLDSKKVVDGIFTLFEMKEVSYLIFERKENDKDFPLTEVIIKLLGLILNNKTAVEEVKSFSSANFLHKKEKLHKLSLSGECEEKDVEVLHDIENINFFDQFLLNLILIFTLESSFSFQVYVFPGKKSDTVNELCLRDIIKKLDIKSINLKAIFDFNQELLFARKKEIDDVKNTLYM